MLNYQETYSMAKHHCKDLALALHNKFNTATAMLCEVKGC